MTREEFYAEVLSLDLGGGWHKRIELGKLELSNSRLTSPVMCEGLERNLRPRRVQYNVNLEDVEKIQISLTEDRLIILCDVLM